MGVDRIHSIGTKFYPCMLVFKVKVVDLKIFSVGVSAFKQYISAPHLHKYFGLAVRVCLSCQHFSLTPVGSYDC